jgi:hypothetical protein
VPGCLIQATRREDDCSPVLSVELLRDADACTRSFEIDVYEGDIWPLAA